MTAIVIDTATLADWMSRRRPLVVLDARARLDDPAAGRRLFRETHIPGAQHADMDADLAAPASALGGRHPLPDKSVFANRLRHWGITPKHAVVAYDDTGCRLAAARAWWMLKWAGHPAVHVLDGGWQAWQTAGQPTEAGEPDSTPSDWQPQFDDSLIASADDVARGDALLLDARAPARFRGEHEPVDAKAGHIPGACNIPGTALLADDQTFKPIAELQTQLPESGNAIAYCGSGVSACQLILASAALGRPLPRLYPGSWSAWISDPARPVATGDG